VNRRRKFLLAGVVAVLAAGASFAQFFRGGWRGGLDANEGDAGSLVRTEGGVFVDEDSVQTARETASHSTGTPNWSNPREFQKDVFTFTRIIFKVGPSTAPAYGRGRRLGWWVDYPDADLNFSYRLQQLTSAKADPDGRVLKLTNPALYQYPFIFMEHPGYIELQEDEVAALRKYLLAGGALVVIDFWNTREWEGFASAMKRVLPERNWTELTTEHPLFRFVYELEGPMSRLQVPTMQLWNRERDPFDPDSPLQTKDRGPGSDNMHVRAWLDDKDRIMAIAIHNSDISDGWEREGEDDAYFRTFAETVSYPFGINLLFYLMTH